ncbi:MAG TPA: hypothetical protein PK885_09395, partial [Candidatus Marinimicrobia bacterium]|nr:hypothetical protein [Candidatus Neomarinimicrobiota bacterium]
MKTKTWKKMISSVFIVLICLQIGFADDVRLKIPESTVNNILAAIVESKYLSYGTSCNIDISFLSLNVAVVTYYSFKPQDISLDISTGNNFSLTIDFKIKANFDTPIFDFLLKASNLSVTINGTIDRVEQGSGYKIRLTPLSLYYNNNDWVNIVLHDQLSGLIAKLPEISTSSSQPLLPNIVASYFTSGTPTLTTTDTSIVLGLTMVAGLRNIKVQNEVNQLNTLGNVQTVVNGSVTGTYPSPKTFEWNTGNVKQVQTPNELIASTNGQNKYKNWYKDDATLPETDIATRRIEITVASSDATYTAKFLQAQRVQLSNVLEGSLTGGTVTYESTTGSMYDSYEYCYNANPVPHSISTNVPSGTLNSDWVFYHWSDGNTSQTRNIVVDSDKNLQASWKGIHRSNAATAFSNNSQRKFVRTQDGWLHQVYESMGRVWLEHSSNNGSTWFLGNNGLPLDDGEGKCPSIDWGHYYYSSSSQGTYVHEHIIVVAYQQKFGNYYKIRYAVFKKDNNVYVNYTPSGSYATLYTESSDQYSVDANPNIAISGCSSGIYDFIISFERKSGSMAGINWFYGKMAYIGIYPTYNNYVSPVWITGTNASSINASVHLNKDIVNPRESFDIVYQQGTQYIKDVILSCSYNGVGNWTTYQFGPFTISQGTDRKSYKPSLVQKTNRDISVSWIRDRTADGGSPYYINAVNWDSENSSVYRIYGSWDVRSVSSNVRDDNTAVYTAWSEAQYIGSSASKNCVARGSSSITLNTHGKYLQLCNGPLSGGSTNMRVSAYDISSSPYFFETSNAIGTSLPKSTVSDINYGRGIALDNGNIGFFYSIKKLSAGKQAIHFIEIPTKPNIIRSVENASIKPLMLDSLNAYLLSEPFSVTEDMEITFVEDGGFTKLLPSTGNVDTLKAVEKGRHIKCKLELIDDDTQKLVGTIRVTQFNLDDSVRSEFKSFKFKTNK